MTVSLTFVSEVENLAYSQELNKQASLIPPIPQVLPLVAADVSIWGSRCIMMFSLALLVLGSMTAVSHWAPSICALLELCLG